MKSKVPNYTYIPRRNISVLKATIDGKILNVDPKTILSGAYVSKETKQTATKLRLAKIDSSNLRDKILKMYKDFAEKEYDAIFEKLVTVNDISEFVKYGLTEEMIIAFYCGIESIMDIKADNEFAYNKLSGIFVYRTDEDGKFVKNWIERGLYNCKNGVFELGFKYPTFNWGFLEKKWEKTEVVMTDDEDYFGEKRISAIKISTFKVSENFSVLAIKSGGYSTNGKWSTQYDETKRYASVKIELNNDYLALVSRNPKELFALAKKLLSQSGSYTKDFDWLLQSKTFGADDLLENKVKFAKGGGVAKRYEVEFEISGKRHKSTYMLYSSDRIEKMLPKDAKIISVKETTKGDPTYAKGGKIKNGDVVAVKEPNYGYNSDYYVVSDKAGYDKDSYLLSDVRKRESSVFSQDQLEKLYAKGGHVQKANVGAYIGIAQAAQKVAPKTVSSLDNKMSDKINRKSFWEKMNETGNKYANGGNITVRKLEKSLENAEKNFRKAVQSERVGVISSEKLRVAKNFLDKKREELNNWYSSRPIKKAMGGGIEDEDFMDNVRKDLINTTDWDNEVRNFAGLNYENLTEEEKQSIISEMKMDREFHNMFKKGGKISDLKYIPRQDIMKIILTNGTVIEQDSWNYSIYSGLRLNKGFSVRRERDKMEEKGQLTLFKKGGKMPQYSTYIPQRNIEKVYLYSENDPTIIDGNELVGGVWYDNEKGFKLIELAKKQGLIK
jgi:hypothetical protein